MYLDLSLVRQNDAGAALSALEAEVQLLPAKPKMSKLKRMHQGR
jgi:hypothetical protein